VRGRGLFIGLDIDPGRVSARTVCERLMERGLLTKETHETVVRLAPPLAIAREQLDWAVAQIEAVLGDLAKQPAPRDAALRQAGAERTG
jgi:ornithine--oxo-acid transaminase